MLADIGRNKICTMAPVQVHKSVWEMGEQNQRQIKLFATTDIEKVCTQFPRDFINFSNSNLHWLVMRMGHGRGISVFPAIKSSHDWYHAVNQHGENFSNKMLLPH